MISFLILGLLRSGLFDFQKFGVSPYFFEFTYLGALLLDVYVFIIDIFKEKIYNSVIIGNFNILSKTD